MDLIKFNTYLFKYNEITEEVIFLNICFCGDCGYVDILMSPGIPTTGKSPIENGTFKDPEIPKLLKMQFQPYKVQEKNIYLL